MQAYDLIANQDILYPKESQVYIHKIIPNEFSVNIQLKSKYCIYNDNKILKNDILTILYPDKQETKIINLTVNCENYFIDLTIVPTSVYIKSNNLAPGHTVVEYYHKGWHMVDLTLNAFKFTYKNTPLSVILLKAKRNILIFHRISITEIALIKVKDTPHSHTRKTNEL